VLANKRLQNDRTSAMHLCSLPLVGGV
jgi:hypothetical protein